MNRKILSFMFAFILLFGVCFASEEQVVKYDDSWNRAGFSLENSSNFGVGVNFSIEEFTLQNITINSEQLQNIILPGVMLPNNEGAPNLPGISRYIALPEGATPELEIVSTRIETFSGIELAPAPRIPKENDNSPLHYEKDLNIYSRDAFYPANPIQISEVKQIRGVDVSLLAITPFQYNPVTKELKIYRDVKVNVTFNGGNGHFGEDRLRSKWWDPIVNDMVLNSESIPEIDYNNRTRETGSEYVIICPDDADFIEWADSIRVFRTMQGISSEVVTTADIGGNNANLIENYIDDAYDNWDIPPVAVLILGDTGTTGTTVISPTWNGYCVSDNVYADVDNDDMPDVILARITARTEPELENMIHKFMDYERTPPVSQDFYDHPVTACGFQTERWFQICSESVGGFWHNELGKEQVRINAIYSGTPGSVWSTATNTSTVVNYFGPNGLGYIPATPGELGGWTGGNATAVNNAINSGAFMLQHRDHGGVSGWGEPNYDIGDLGGLSNDELVYVFSINCLTGKFDAPGQCFAEAMHRMQHGALGLIAASEVSYSFVNDTYVWGMYDNLWPEFMPDFESTPAPRGVLPAFGNAAGKYFLQQSSWPYNTSNKEVTYYLFHQFGDAFSTVYTEMPQDIAVNHQPILLSGVDFFTITAEEGSHIALTVDGVIIGTGEGTGAPINISIDPQIPPAIVDLVITKQNCYRYHTQLQVIPPDGAYVVFDSYEIDDSAGNNNGQVDYGESIALDVGIHNVGNLIAENVDVEISTEDEFVTITDNTENYGNIDPDGFVSLTDAFSFDVAEIVPDMHTVVFTLTATDIADSVWESGFALDLHSPILEYDSFTINDQAGNNNGRLDPGETVDFSIIINNVGSSVSNNVMGELTTNDPYVTINTPPVNYGSIEEQSSGEQVYSVTAAEDTPTGHMAEYNFAISDEVGYTGEGSLMTYIGQIPILIVDLDENTNSASAIQSAVDEIGVGGVYVTSIPTDEIEIYSSVFVCLGIYYQNHVLSNAEGQILANYLNSGGNLYMEGGDTWYYDSPTPVHSMFNINGVSDGSSDLGTINGETGTFTEDMSYSYVGDNSWIDHLAPIGNAETIFSNQSPAYDCAVAYEADDYSTIGASFEFGGLSDGTSTKEELMTQYLIFFGIITDATGTLEGVVTDMDTGDPIEDAMITAGAFTTQTDADGEYSFLLETGIYEVSCTIAGYVEQTVTGVEILQDQTTVLDFQLQSIGGPVTNLTGTVMNYQNVQLDWDQPEIPFDFPEDFEGYADFAMEFAPWTNVDVDQSGTYGMVGITWPGAYDPQAYMIFNPSETEPPITDMAAHSGDKFATCFAATTPPNNDWLITPHVSIENGDLLSLWVKSYTDQYGLERYNIGVSVTGTNPEDFEIISQSPYEEAPAEDWTEVSWDLSAYAGEDVYVGIQCVSNDAFIFMVDDVNIGSTSINFAFNSNTTSNGKVTRLAPSSKILRELKFKKVGQTENTRELEGYEIYRDDELIGTVLNAGITSYEDITFLGNGVYAYDVVAVYTEGNSVPASIDVEIELPPVENLAVAFSEPNVIVTWDEPSGERAKSSNKSEEAAPIASGTRDLVEYKVYLDGLLDGTTTNVFYNFINIANEHTAGIAAVYEGGFVSGIVEITFDSPWSVDPEITVTALEGNFPNPFSSSTNISFSLKNPSHVSLSIYNLKGQLVERLMNEYFEGNQRLEIVWDGTKDGRKLGNGIYYYKLETDTQSFLKKMILMK